MIERGVSIGVLFTYQLCFELHLSFGFSHDAFFLNAVLWQAPTMKMPRPAQAATATRTVLWNGVWRTDRPEMEGRDSC